MLDRPIDALNEAKGKRVLLKLKNRTDISGILKAHDLHFNIWLMEVELKKEDETIKTKSMLIRGDTILYVIL